MPNETNKFIHFFSSVKLSFPGSRSPSSAHYGNTCPYCDFPLHEIKSELKEDDHGWDDGDMDIYRFTLETCQICGWWRIQGKQTLVREADSHCTVNGWAYAEAVMRRLPVNSLEIPTEELRRYLAQRYDSRFDIHPRKLEEVLKSVFKDHGFDVQLTAYTKDGGIDLYLLRDPDEELIAVQAKRNKATRKIGVEEIDRFLGTMVRQGISQGIYVTTSAYTSGARDSVIDMKNQGFLLDLWDADDLLRNLTSKEPLQEIDSAQVVWDDRLNMPYEMELFGDYYGSAWPTRLPADNDIERWTKHFEQRCKK